MIFKSLSLTNFRVFNGEHNIDLQLRKSGLLSRPIILMGGLNGAGKTSILSAIRLILLGRRSISGTLSPAGYKKYLIQQTNNNAKNTIANVKTFLSLQFSHTHQGKHSIYIVNRSWDSTGTESLSLNVDGSDLSELSSDQVQSFLSEIIPPGIGDLFFFDGEKIAELAEDDTGKYLKEAVQKLLGIDVIQRLGNDLDIYLKQLGKDKADESLLKKIILNEKEKKEWYDKATLSRELAEALAPALSELKSNISKYEAKIQERGGAWAATREKEKATVDQLIKDNAILESKLLRELDDTYPLSLAPKAISKLLEQLRLDRKTKEDISFVSNLNKHSNKIAAMMANKLSLDEQAINETIVHYINNLPSKSAQNEILLDISDSEFYKLENLVEESVESSAEVASTSKLLSATKSELETLSVNIQRAPKEEEISSLYEKLREYDKQYHSLKNEYLTHLEKAKTQMSKAIEAAKRLEKQFNQQQTEATSSKVESRIESTQKLLDDFSKELTNLRVTQLETLFTKAYRRLARKEDLKLSAQISPDTFDVTLVDNENNAINRKSLSAGEKQIFAFAILEALGRLSGKILPVVIDTPLGRLDSKHRDKLIKYYFPEAGEQVILLSTDTEVDQDFVEQLSPHLSHSFEIAFDEKTRCSSISGGYFGIDAEESLVNAAK